MLEFGYIRLFRSLTSWEWYTDSNTKDVFLHLILTANYEPKKWRGITVERGQRVFSYSKLASELRLPVQPVRTAIKHLVSTGEVTCSGNREYSIVTVKNYDSYQQLTNEPTNIQQANLMNNMLTNENSSKIQHTNQQTSNMQNSQVESQNISPVISEATHVSTNEQHTINMPSTHGQQQCKKAKESNKAINNIYIGLFSEYVMDDDLLLNALKDFAEMRAAMKKPFSTERAAQMLLTKLDTLASDSKTKVAILEQSTFHNWQSVFPLKGETDGRFTNNVSNTGQGSAGSEKEAPKYGHVV